MESKTFGTDIIGITIWKNELIRCIEFNTFFLDVHFYADTLGELKIIFGTLNRLYFKIAIEIKSD